jgi:hypothetical protein
VALQAQQQTRLEKENQKGRRKNAIVVAIDRVTKGAFNAGTPVTVSGVSGSATTIAAAVHRCARNGAGRDHAVQQRVGNSDDLRASGQHR